MKMTLSTYDIADALYADKDGGWSRAGAWALAEYLEEYEDSTGEEIELDVVAFRCDFWELSSLQECIQEYTTEDDHHLFKTEDGWDDELIRTYLNDNTTLIEFDGGVIVGSF